MGWADMQMSTGRWEVVLMSQLRGSHGDTVSPLSSAFPALGRYSLVYVSSNMSRNTSRWAVSVPVQHSMHSPSKHMQSHVPAPKSRMPQ